MAEVRIPFQARWKEAMLSGQKCCTSRPRRYGQEGDEFAAFGIRFRLFDVGRMKLGHVAEHLYLFEGCGSPKEFMRAWCVLHPAKGFVFEQQVWVHQFERVSDGR